MERIFKLKKTSRQKLLSFICPDLAAVADWAYVPTSAYRILRRVTPGKYTFVLRASKEVPKILLQKRPTVGVRIPDSAVALGLVARARPAAALHLGAAGRRRLFYRSAGRSPRPSATTST